MLYDHLCERHSWYLIWVYKNEFLVQYVKETGKETPAHSLFPTSQDERGRLHVLYIVGDI